MASTPGSSPIELWCSSHPPPSPLQPHRSVGQLPHTPPAPQICGVPDSPLYPPPSSPTDPWGALPATGRSPAPWVHGARLPPPHRSPCVCVCVCAAPSSPTDLWGAPPFPPAPAPQTPGRPLQPHRRGGRPLPSPPGPTDPRGGRFPGGGVGAFTGSRSRGCVPRPEAPPTPRPFRLETPPTAGPASPAPRLHGNRRAGGSMGRNGGGNWGGGLCRGLGCYGAGEGVCGAL